jgi:nucleotide-binding universal stress UspA family protein
MTAPVVVGVSPTTGSPNALRWSAEEARLRKAPLRAVLAWRPPRAPGAPGGRPPATVVSIASEDHAKAAEDTLRGFISAALGDDVDIECTAVRGTAVTALLASARDAQLLVLGEARPGRISSMRASLVAPQVVLRALCPVVVLPTQRGAAS